MISLVGVCWAVACWVPFAIIMEVWIHPPVLYHPTWLTFGLSF
jgi:hypothetical protein